jgi:N-acetyl-anhydromuramyl-L-alanine amidase AmpD
MARARRRTPLLAACTALAAGGILALPGATADAAQAVDGPSSLQSDFAAAAAEFHVPLPVLMSVSYQESSWDGHAGAYSADGGYGPMNLTDVTPAMLAGQGSGAAGRADLAELAADPARHTLDAAARLLKVPAARLRGDEAQNIRGGAALLASYERALTGGTPADPGAWYGAVARYSQATGQSGAKAFANRVYDTLARGAGRTAQGQPVRLAATPAVRPDTAQLARLKLAADTGAPAECPVTVDCTFLPAAATNYQVANRPADGMAIRYIVIHDTESSYESAIAAFQSPADGAAANYVMQSSTGAVTQMVADKDVAFQAGNYWFNMHSVGIEHEGFAAAGATWYTQAQYQATADLVKYLAARYGIPLDRRHIIGHDNVPGPRSSYVAGMHYDPGPYWDWNRFMRLLGEQPPRRHHKVPRTGSAVTITPDFAANAQTVQVCGQPSGEGGSSGSTSPCTTQSEPSNLLPVRTAPAADAPLFADPAVHSDGSAGTDRIDDWGATVTAGQQFVVADVSGDWTAIWFSGAKVWFYNPGGVNTTPAPGAHVLSAKAGAASAPVYGQAYPQAAEYPSDLSPSVQEPLSMYTIPAGQAYVADCAPVHADDFFSKASGSHPADTVVTGSETYYTVQYNHRVVLVNSDDVVGQRN